MIEVNVYWLWLIVPALVIIFYAGVGIELAIASRWEADHLRKPNR